MTMAAAARTVKVEDSVAVVAAAVFVDPPVAGPSIIGKGVGQLGSTVGAEAFAHVATAGLPHMSSLPVQVSHFSRAGQVYPSIVDIAAGRRSLDMTLALPPIQFAETRVAVSNVDSFEQQHHRHGEGRQGMAGENCTNSVQYSRNTYRGDSSLSFTQCTVVSPTSRNLTRSNMAVCAPTFIM